MAEDTNGHEPEREAHERSGETDALAEPSSDDGSEDGGADELSVESLTEAIERVQAEKDAQFDQLVRLKAEFENYRKRVHRDIQRGIKHAEEELLLRLLGVLDSFDRALSQPVPESNMSAVREGLAQIRQQFHDALAASGIATVESVGAKFDPYYHEAMLTVESDEHEENTVVNELERGYTLRGKVIRPAKVAVNVSRRTEAEEASSSKTDPDKRQ